MAPGYQQFRNKAEAERALTDMEAAAVRAARLADEAEREGHSGLAASLLLKAGDRKVEAVRIRALIPSLPE